MNSTQVVVRGVLNEDGTLVLREPVDFPPGPVEVVLRPVPPPATGGENWWQYLQRARAELEAMGHRFATAEEVHRDIEELRSGDERIEEVHRRLEEEKSRQGGAEC